jgi:hypothetical protein
MTARAAAAGLTRQVQEDFSGGMVRSGAPEHIPANAAWDITNGLLDHTGGTFKRGGSAYRSKAFDKGLRFIWDGWLANGQHTIVGSSEHWGSLSGETVTSLGAGGVARAGRAAALAGVLYLPGGKTYDGTTFGEALAVEMKGMPYYAVVANRLLAAEGSKVLFSPIGKPAEHVATDFHQLPGGVEIVGLEGLRSSAAVFTTGGVWVVGNLAKNLTDATGNVQQTLDLYSQDLVLWGSGGIAAWEGALIVPGTEAVYLLSLGVTSEKSQSLVRISDPIVDLYQEYARSGYSVGQATVYKNQYLLPIISGGNVIDTLVCRLDLTAKGSSSRPWTHLKGSGAKMGALTTRVVVGSSRTPELLGAQYGEPSRVVNLSFYEPTANNETDCDGTVPAWGLTTRSYATGNLVPNLVTKLRVRYQLEGNASPKLIAQTSSESEVPPPGSAVWHGFTWGGTATWATPTELALEPIAGEAPPCLDGAKAYSWHPRKKRRFVRFRLSCQGATSQLALRSLEMFTRPEGRL